VVAYSFGPGVRFCRGSISNFVEVVLSSEPGELSGLVFAGVGEDTAAIFTAETTAAGFNESLFNPDRLSTFEKRSGRFLLILTGTY